MLYCAYEMNRTAAAQLRSFTAFQSMFLRHAFNPWSRTSGGRGVAAACDVFGDLTRHYRKPSFALDTTLCDGDEVAVDERIVKRKPFGQLKHFARDVARPDDPRLLVVPPLSGHFSTLLRDTVSRLLPEYDVYLADWRNARMVPVTAGRFGLDEYVDYVIDFLDYLGPDTHVLAVCQATVPVLTATALMAEDGHAAAPRSLSLMGGPIDARITPTVPNKLATDHDLGWFRRNMVDTVPALYPGAMRQVYPGFMQLGGFMSMNPSRHVDAYRKLYRSIIADDAAAVRRHRQFYDEYFAVMDLPGAFYLDTIERVFQQFHLARGCMTHHGRAVDPAAIRDTALFTIEGENDDICSVGQTAAAHDLCPNVPDARRLHRVQPGVGHYGVFSGRHWRDEIAPQLHDFIRAA